MPPRPRLKSLPLRRLFPNMITTGALCCGLMGIRWALTGNWETAVIFIMVAAVLDGMDGRIARMLKASSQFGAQLDSLSDFICFGVAPPLMLYLWNLKEVKGYGWAIVLFFAVCTAFRLARFNTALSEEHEPWEKMFFTGIPSPAGAMLCLLPLVMSFYSETAYNHPAFNIFYVAVVGALMASRFPTFSLKGGMRIRQDLVLPVMLGFGLLVVAFVTAPWATYIVCGIAYLLHLPVAAYVYRRKRLASAAARAVSEDTL
jgi:CDP-diacylglycerol--serine O-phosphatidyltransferase